MCKDCKVIPSELLGTQHRLLVMDLRIKGLKAKKRSASVVELDGQISQKKMRVSYQKR